MSNRGGRRSIASRRADGVANSGYTPFSSKIILHRVDLSGVESSAINEKLGDLTFEEVGIG